MAINLENLEKHILPKESHLTPLKSRDVLPNGKQIHQLILTYSFTLSESATVTPHFPLFGRILYESSVENFAFYLFNSEKKVMTYRDIFFKSIKLGAGEYTLQAQVASSSTEILTKLKSLGLVLSIKLAKAITPSIYTSLAECLSDGEKFKAIKLSKGGRVCFWIGSVTGIPSFAEPGDLLTGKLDVADEITLKESLFTAAYVVTKEFKEKKNEPVVTEKEPEKPQRLLLENAQRDLSISWLAKFPKEERDQYMAEIEKQYPDYLGLFVQYLQLIFADFEKDSKNENLKALNLKYAQKVIDLIDESDVARYFGVQHEDIEKSEIQKNKQKDYQEKRDALIWAYKARALAHIGEENKESFDQAMSNFSKWNTEGKKRSDYLLLWVGLMKQQENYGSALKQINTFLGDEKNSKDSNLKAIREAKLSILQKIGWDLWIDYETRHAPIRSPGGYASF
jgi:tripeptidyl-peptidase-2